MKRSSLVTWEGAGKAGSGIITCQSHALNKATYSWHSRFDSAKGTNPEELLASAHAACFTMKLSFLLEAAGFASDIIETNAEVTLEKDLISHSHLNVRAKVSGITNEKFMELANNARDNCMVSKALNMEITMDASLIESQLS
jgi:osmotically inducible protein OsmC